ncbi:hypothetical protein F2Q69_00032910 [Brassica cretica]|uniref:Uncharacterized protein n=1 Tax=Brassica cretica TaxID=69181 RepID=A0A8S9SH08_BRACR|nr:hypothetical protein F2Q69_00032910 [Brassica cretica]
MTLRFTSTSSSSPIEEQRNRVILSFLQTKTLEPLKSQAMAMKRNGKSLVSSDSDEKVMFFKSVSLGPPESQLRFRLIHFWEARVKKTLIGVDHVENPIASATLAGDFGIGSEQLLPM